MSRLAVVVLPLLQLWTGGAVRTQVSDVLEVLDDPGTDEAVCVDSLRAIVNATSYADLFRPVLDGIYMIRHIDGDREQNLGLSGGGEVHLTSDTAFTYWKLKQSPRDIRSTDMPSFTLKNRRKRVLLATTGSSVIHAKARRAGAESQWRFEISPSGKYFAIRNVGSGLFLNNMAGSLQAMHEPEAAWELVPVRKLGSRNFNKEMAKQWAVVSNTPVLPYSNSRLTWGEVNHAKKAVPMYAGERKRYQTFGKIAETDRHVVSESKVLNVCDMAVNSMRGFTNNINVVRELSFSELAHQCPRRNEIVDFQRLWRQALEEECFGSCMSTMAKLLPSRIECGNHKEANMTEIFETAIAQDWQCSNMMPDNLEYIMEYQAQQHCWKFPPPQLLWTYNDHAAHDIASSEWTEAACTVYHTVRYSSNNHEDVVQHHACTEGTTCQCPETWGNKEESTADIRKKGSNTVFVVPGVAMVPGLWNAYKKKVMIGSAVKGLYKAVMFGTMSGFSASAALHMATSATFIAPIVIEGIQGAKNKWRCFQTVGCWPLMPHAVQIDSSTVCRMPDEAIEGGSPAWFLPAPGLKAELDTESRLVKCHLHPCNDTERRAQLVGLGGTLRTNIYNCQPLTFMDMSYDQKAEFSVSLRASGITSEYELSF